jgi:hypothetical protein
MVTHINNGTSTSYSLPYSFVPFFNGTSAANSLMVVGDNGTVFATNGGGPTSPYGGNTVFAFDENNGTVNWSYSVPSSGINQSGDGITIVGASDGGGLVVKSTSNGVDSVIDLDASGSATTDPLSGNGISYLFADLWLRQSTGGGPTQGSTGNPISWVAGGPWLIPGIFSRASQQITIPLNVYRVQTSGSPSAISNDSIDSQVSGAVQLWGKLVRGLTLQYGGENKIISAPACDTTLHPSGCSSQQNVSTLFLDTSYATPSMAEFKTRFGNSSGLQLVFTGTVDAHPPGGQSDLFPDEAVPYDPPGQSTTFGNIVVMSNASTGNIPAHGIGHSFQLVHVSGDANAQNLMCSPGGEGCPADVPGSKLNKDQIQAVLQNALKWQPAQ